MDRPKLISIALATLALSGCAVGERLGWTRHHEVPNADVKASCERSVKSLEGQADHATAMQACVDATSRQGRRGT